MSTMCCLAKGCCSSSILAYRYGSTIFVPENHENQ